MKTLLLALLLAPTLLLADTAAEQGRALAEKADAKHSGWQDVEAVAKMVLRTKGGKESNRQMRVKLLEDTGSGGRGMVVFDTPRDVKGVAFLTHTTPGESDQQWLYMPAIKRVKRIAAKTRNGSFMGSELSYEDLGSQDIDRYSYTLLGEDTYNGQPCYKLERRPMDKNSGYKRHVLWLDKAELNTHKVEYYDRKDSLLKTLTAKGFRLYNGKHWRAESATVLNHQTKKSTYLAWLDVKYAQGLSSEEFTQAHLKRLR